MPNGTIDFSDEVACCKLCVCPCVYVLVCVCVYVHVRAFVRLFVGCVLGLVEILGVFLAMTAMEARFTCLSTGILNK